MLFEAAQSRAREAARARDREPARAVALLAEALAAAPGLWTEFGDAGWIALADEHDPGAAIELRLARLRASLPEPGDEAAVSDAVGERIRERYSELLELCADHPDELARVRELGRHIDELVGAGVLPRGMVLRGAGSRHSRKGDPGRRS